jgi:hypothetical protein
MNEMKKPAFVLTVDKNLNRNKSIELANLIISTKLN